MCLPVNDNASTLADPPAGLGDLHEARNDVVAEVMKAPSRRIDNVVTHLHDSVHLLSMHATLLQEVRRLYRRQVWNHRLSQSVSLLSGAGLSSLTVYAQLPLEFAGGVVGVTVLGVGGLSWFQSVQRKEYQDMLTTPEALNTAFRRCYAREITEADEFTASVWQRVKESVQLSLQSMGSLDNVPSVGSSEFASLQTILKEDIPKLRRLASPTQLGKRKEQYTQ
mmetsp:Transcript_22551/g.52026  ORF Transcript_22551/g.52026 Transcript_22551/m.52026 type:complete len:223 (-) Transcript_22551:374-1042(-)|eukprot:CAMPEP_0116865124 /NCGR_PEP_ID=MMETSP0418-20121206/25220_1 /TAXON_ID=1158023 /ORGANISM="Astrosyne radiata, Strain 13vi08-1A" /LENGTH=222 /DNA_ID=CAMNT_0004500455 /DNA_START=171 /DNA_END=839 /DNA_ORIENTATION=-